MDNNDTCNAPPPYIPGTCIQARDTEDTPDHCPVHGESWPCGGEADRATPAESDLKNYGYSAFGQTNKCPHNNFVAQVDVSPRYASPEKRCAHVRVKCSDCGTHFRFDEMPHYGVFGGDQVSGFPNIGFTAILPIVPLTPLECRIIDETDPIRNPGV